jgi:hypothetical protein
LDERKAVHRTNGGRARPIPQTLVLYRMRVFGEGVNGGGDLCARPVKPFGRGQTGFEEVTDGVSDELSACGDRRCLNGNLPYLRKWCKRFGTEPRKQDMRYWPGKTTRHRR